ncbi:MAG: glycosyltransferase family 4 protein, partial [candidate division WOR-3 bacterium]
ELSRLGHQTHILTTNYPQIPPNSYFPSASQEPFSITRLGRALILPSNRSRFVLPVGYQLPFQVKRFFSHNRFEIVHCHGVFPPELAYWAINYAPSPVVVTFHTLRKQFPSFVRKSFQTLFPKITQKIRAKIAVSQVCRKWSEAWFPGDYHIIPNGIDINIFRPDVPPAAGLSSEHQFILYVGRLDLRKGLIVLLSALPAILKVHPKVKLVVVGTGPLVYRARKLCTALGIERSVIFAGQVAPEELPGYYSGCTIFVSPALGGEAMGIVLLEALAAGKPIVASAIPGYTEVLTHNETGILVPPGDSRALANAIIQLLDSPELRQRLSQQGLAYVAQFSWSVIAKKVEEVYQSLL